MYTGTVPGYPEFSVMCHVMCHKLKWTCYVCVLHISTPCIELFLLCKPFFVQDTRRENEIGFWVILFQPFVPF